MNMARGCKRARLLKREYDKYFTCFTDLFGKLLNDEDMSLEELDRLGVMMAWDKGRRAVSA